MSAMISTTTDSRLLDPLVDPSAGFIQNPYPTYKLLRDHEPVLWNKDRLWWIVTSYEAVSTTLRDPRLKKRHSDRCPMSRFTLPFFKKPQPNNHEWIALQDPPQHTHLREFLNAAFVSAGIERLGPLIEDTCHQLLDRHGKLDSQFDIVNQYALPLVFQVFLKFLGFEEEDFSLIKHWCDEMFLDFDIPYQTSTKPRADRATVSFQRYIEKHLQRRKGKAREDLLTQLMLSAKCNSKIGRSAFVANIVLLAIGGYETTASLIASGALALMRHPEQLDILRSKPDLMPSAIEEFLRYDAPVQIVSYFVGQKLELGGRVLEPGHRVQAFIGAANRDPRVFDNPDHLDIQRQNNRHLSFGAGIHYCLGAKLARFESQIAFRVLLERAPNLRLASDQITYSNFRPRKLSSLLVSLS